MDAGEADTGGKASEAPRSLRSKTARAGVWVAALRGIQRLVSLLRLVILARLLAPQDFGLFGITLLALSFLETFTQTGSEITLIRKKDPDADFLHTAWTVQLLRSALLAVLMMVCSGWVARFFDAPEAAGLLKLMAAAVLIRGGTSIGVVLLRKELHYRPLFVYSMTNTLIDLVATVLLACWLRNAWALVWGRLVAQCAACLVSYAVAPYRPRWMLARGHLGEFYRFGRWIFSSSFIIYLLREGDDIVLGRMAGTMALGFYQMAYRISNLPATQITHVVSRIALPAYSSIRDRPEQLRRVFLETLQLVCAVSLPVGVGILITAPTFTPVLLGQQWLPAVPAIQLLALFGMIRSIGANAGPLFLATGRPDLETRLLLAKLVLLAAIIFPMISLYGLYGACWAVLINAALMKPVTDYLAARLIGSPFRQVLAAQVWALCCAAVMGLVLVVLDHAVPQPVSALKLVVQIAMGAVVYMMCLLAAERWTGMHVMQSVRKLWKGFRE